MLKRWSRSSEAKRDSESSAMHVAMGLRFGQRRIMVEDVYYAISVDFQ